MSFLDHLGVYAWVLYFIVLSCVLAATIYAKTRSPEELRRLSNSNAIARLSGLLIIALSALGIYYFGYQPYLEALKKNPSINYSPHLVSLMALLGILGVVLVISGAKLRNNKSTEQFSTPVKWCIAIAIAVVFLLVEIGYTTLFQSLGYERLF